MPDATTKLGSLLAALLLALVGCSEQSDYDASNDPPSAESSCTLTSEQTTQVRMSALEYVIAEWPTLDALCEEISNEVTQRPDGTCAISGGPVEKQNCPAPSERGYLVIFDATTLEPSGVIGMPPGS